MQHPLTSCVAAFNARHAPFTTTADDTTWNGSCSNRGGMRVILVIVVASAEPSENP